MASNELTVTGKNVPEFSLAGLTMDDAADISRGLRLIAGDAPHGRSVRQRRIADDLDEVVRDTLGWPMHEPDPEEGAGHGI